MLPYRKAVVRAIVRHFTHYFSSCLLLVKIRKIPHIVRDFRLKIGNNLQIILATFANICKVCHFTSR